MLFADLVGFTGFAERSSPAEVAAVLDAYWGMAAPLITRRFGGEVEKFIGDGIMATFNNRGDQPDHAQRASCAALALQDSVARLAEQHPDWPPMRVGVNSGGVIVREIGSDGHVAYPVVGDTVNTGARLESSGAGRRSVDRERRRTSVCRTVPWSREWAGIAREGQGRRRSTRTSCTPFPARQTTRDPTARAAVPRVRAPPQGSFRNTGRAHRVAAGPHILLVTYQGRRQSCPEGVDEVLGVLVRRSIATPLRTARSAAPSSRKEPRSRFERKPTRGDPRCSARRPSR